MERLTTRHNGVAVIKDKSKHKEAMDKLAQYEELEERNIQAKDLVTVKITGYFEVKDSKMYGGSGSVGYTESSISGNGTMTKIDTQQFINNIKSSMAQLLEVPEECVRIISEDEYRENTDDEEEEEV